MRGLFIAIFLLPAFLGAQPFPHFDPHTVQKFEGVILSVQTYGQVTQPTPHKHIYMRTPQGEEVVVDLGPEWYLNTQGIELYEDEKVEVVGSLMRFNGTHYVTASSITINHTTYKLREKNGLPVWRRR